MRNHNFSFVLPSFLFLWALDEEDITHICSINIKYKSNSSRNYKLISIIDKTCLISSLKKKCGDILINITNLKKHYA